MNGTERHCWELAERLHKRGHEVEVFFMPMNPRPHLQVRPLPGVKVNYFPNSLGKLEAPFEIQRLRRALKQFKPDVVSAHNLKMGYVSALAMSRKVPIVNSIHLAEDSRKRIHRKLLKTPFRIFSKPLLKRMTFIGVSREIAEHTMRDLHTDNVYLIPDWTWVSDYLSKANGKVVRKHFPKNAFIFLTIARIAQEKGWTYLMDAAEKVCKKYKNAYFAAVGDGDKMQEYEQLARDKGLENRFKFLGRFNSNEQIAGAYKGADAIILPAPMDYLFTLMESVASGKPVIATAMTSTKEVLTDEKDALLVEPKSAESIEQAAMRIISQPKLRSRLVKSMRLTAKRFDPDLCISQIEHVFEEAVQKAKN
jgi:glycosyltransferase involved in cell wall biosynthesis